MSKVAPKLIVFAGSIGTGKSLLAIFFNSYINVMSVMNSILYKEPIPKRLLSLFLRKLTISETSLVSYSVQHTYNASRFRDLTLGLFAGRDVVIQDQGLWFDLAFLEVLKDSLTRKQYDLYKAIINQRIELLYTMYLDITVIFLDQTVKVQRKNIATRNRDNEKDVYTVEYLTNLTREMKKIFTGLIKSNKVRTLTYTFGPPSTDKNLNLKLLQQTSKSILSSLITTDQT